MRSLRDTGFERSALLAVLLSVVSFTSAHGDDGRVELNQASALASGGFPVVLTSSGSYVLTSNLVVSGVSSIGVRIDALDVTLDLNGFTVAGPGSGTGVGIQAGRRVTVRSGIVTGFGGVGVLLGSFSRAEGLTLVDNDGGGLVMAAEGAVTRCLAVQNGGVGLLLGTGTLFTENVSAANTGASVSGGFATGGNRCDDGLCSRVARRRFYLTQTPVPGADADVQCTAGFHFASFYEISDVSSLEYAYALGATRADSGVGPPSMNGWVRTGYDSSINNTQGSANCALWSVSDAASYGSGVRLNAIWDSGVTSPGIPKPWDALGGNCANLVRAWCVEN